MRSIPEVKALFVNGERQDSPNSPGSQVQSSMLGCPLCLFTGTVEPLSIAYMIEGTSYCMTHAQTKARKAHI